MSIHLCRPTSTPHLRYAILAQRAVKSLSCVGCHTASQLQHVCASQRGGTAMAASHELSLVNFAYY